MTVKGLASETWMVTHEHFGSQEPEGNFLRMARIPLCGRGGAAGLERLMITASAGVLPCCDRVAFGELLCVVSAHF